MVAAQLVRSDINAGLNLVRALDENDFGVSAAMWIYHSDLERWRMVIAFRDDRKNLEKKYQQAASISATWRKNHPDDEILDLAKVKITSSDDPLVSGLKQAIQVDGISEVWFSNNNINGIYLEDALIHRIAA